MFVRSSGVLLVLSFSLLATAGCKRNGKGTKDNNDNNDPSVWMVGDEGTMIRVDQVGESETYPLELDADLLTIACHGSETAWVAGDAGTVLHTKDAGETWDTVALGLTADWRALAVAEHTPEGSEAVWLVGSGGAVAHTPDGGETWIAVPGATVEFTAVATEPDGNWALAVAEDGSIWELDSDQLLTQIATTATPLHGIALSGMGDHEVAVAVGDDGSMVYRLGSTGSWTTIELPTTRDLYAVRVTSEGDQIVAVGAAGTVVEVALGVDGVTAELPELGLGTTLRALHLGHDGRAQVVGDAGTILVRTAVDLGWTDLSIEGMPTLRGVDDFQFGAHL